MRLQRISIHDFRGIRNAEVANCSGLNILIGKNNAGKSAILAAIGLAMEFLRSGQPARRFRGKKLEYEFYGCDTSAGFRIDVRFDLPVALGTELRDRIQIATPSLARSIQELNPWDWVEMGIEACWNSDDPFLFLRSVNVGKGEAGGPEMRQLLAVDGKAAVELYSQQSKVQTVRDELDAAKKINDDERFIDYFFRDPDSRDRAIRTYQLRRELVSDRIREIIQAAQSATSMKDALDNHISGLHQEEKTLLETPIETYISTLSGNAHVVPEYVGWLAQVYGSQALLLLGEERRAIGTSEADTILKWKTKRGGSKSLEALQSVVRSLLGVKVDAFSTEESAEIDIDDFLVSANGSGIREALRLVFDTEVSNPSIILVEEPELHLHPGLAKAIGGFLRARSESVQVFLTTHSTELLEAGVYNNVYLVRRNGERGTVVQQLTDENEGVNMVPPELGLSLGAVFMRDRLVFVEGEQDERILRELAQTAGIDLSKANVGFVPMLGIRNFGHFAASSTLSFLSRRQAKLIFIVDRDEAETSEIASMVKQLGDYAVFKPWARRELENYLLVPRAITEFINRKKASKNVIEESAVIKAMRTAAVELKSECVRLRVEKQLLAPIYLRGRDMPSGIEDSLALAAEEVNRRMTQVEDLKSALEGELASRFDSPDDAMTIVPGAVLLQTVAEEFGVRYRKNDGDGVRLARLIRSDEIAEEVKLALRECASL